MTTAARTPRPVKKTAAAPPAKTDEQVTGLLEEAVGLPPATGTGYLAYTALATVVDIPIGLLRPSPANQRGETLPNLKELADSIREVGILEPLEVLPAGEDGLHEIVFGHRRHAAGQLAQIKTAPCIITAVTDPTEVVLRRFTENVQREALTPLQEAAGYAELKNPPHNLTQKDIAARMGRNPGHVTKRLQLLDVPTVIAERVGAADRPIPIELVLQIAKLPPAAQVDLATRVGEGADADDLVYRIRGLEVDAARDLERAKQLAAVTKAGIAVLNPPDGDGAIVDVDLSDQVNGPVSLGALSLNRDSHPQSLPCFAAVALTHGRHDYSAGGTPKVTYVLWVCTDPASHRTEALAEQLAGNPSAPKETAAEKKDRLARQARAEMLGEEDACRRAFAGTIVRGKLGADTEAFLACAVISTFALAYCDFMPAIDRCDDVVALTGLEVEESDTYGSARLLIDAVAAGNPTGNHSTARRVQLTRYALAAALDRGLDSLRATMKRGPGLDLTARVDAALLDGWPTWELLLDSGYVPSDNETRTVATWPPYAAVLEADCAESDLLPALDNYGLPQIPVDVATALRRQQGVTDDCLTKASLAGVAPQLWLKPAAATPTGKCSVCRQDAKANGGGSDRPGRHKNGDGDPCETGRLLTLRDLEDLTCGTCDGVGSDERGTGCPDCQGRGLIARIDMAPTGGPV